ncbi:non-ribosomal peptide synthase/polyketide synthase [Bradyrhizobium prioriisuperbiae]|uniref:non-ribosomal peptide synthase/polyketide synthase n=1 Tax=Bradyrhizobium prioriisuperbiae TaxID=2854389 RepID=UPI0028E65747|nr:non-ribosomal peptide synthase/polyketide synthase [Bradyrhizobium prioritasuperba]
MTDTAASQNAQLLEISRRLMRLDPAKQQAFLKQLATKGVNLSMLPIPRLETTRAPLSFAQTRLWFLWRMDPASAAYNMPVAVRVRGRLDVPALQQAFDELVRRHESLRTVFGQDGDQVEQIVQDPVAVAIRRVALGGDDREAQARRLVRSEAAEPFDLARGPLLRVALLALGEDDHILVVTLHHIIADGWSMGVLIEEFWQLYDAHAQGQPAALPAPAVQYADYALWQRLWASAVDGERQLAYWTERLGGEQVRLELPLDRIRPAEPDQRGAVVRLALDPALVEGMRQLARAQRTTLFTVLLAGFKLLLRCYTGQSDLSVGVPVANRHRDETRRMMGLFVNTQVLRSRLDGRQSVTDVIAQVRDTAAEAQDNQDLPFERLVEVLQPQRSLSQSPLFQVLYNHQRRGATAPPTRTGLTIEKLGAEIETVKFDLALDTEESAAGEVSAIFSYATALFETATIERLASHWITILKAMVADPTSAIADIALLSADELAAIQGWNALQQETAQITYPPVHQAVARHAVGTPGAPALIFGDDVISYGELDRCANRLAQRLIRSGVRPGDLVGIAARRAPSLVAGLLAVLKTGAAYLPLDPDHPPARQAQAVRDAGARVVLANEGAALALPDLPDVAVIALDAADLADEPAVDPAVAVHSQSLAYVIYTSGSTGIPKGVAVAHGPFAMHCTVTAPLYDMDRQSRELHFLSFTFDGAHERLWTALACGAALVMRDEELWSPERTLEVMRAQRVTNAGFPTAYLQQIADFADWRGNPPPVSLYSFGGEAMPRSGFDKVARALKPRTLLNGYGPTETVVTPLVWKVAAGTGFEGSYAPIGRPVGARSAYVLDDDLNLVPVGVTGELYIGGEGLARGYWDRAGLTAERFIPDPFDGPGGRLYRTGDLARWRADGVVEYVGRSDHQVKIRGFRIELGEIEARLLQQAGVRAAVVVAREAGAARQLVGYVSGDATLDGVALRAALSSLLPDYMMPARIMVLDRLPVMPSGKVDRQALPEPEAIAAGTDHVAPRTGVETTLAAIWAELLGYESVGVTDNFFELGGDSIVSLQMVSRARQAGLVIEPRDVFRHQTLEALARAARTDDNAQAGMVAEQGLVQGAHPLLPIQLRFFSEDAGERHHWNQAVLLQPRTRLDWAVLGQALAAVVDHHDALRLRFVETDGVWSAAHGAAPAVSELLWVRDHIRNAAEVTAEAASAQASLSLSSGPLLRAVGMDLADGSQRLLVAIHHLVVDGVSWRVLLEDVAAAFGQLASGAAAVALALKSQSFASWGARLQAHATTQQLAAELPYWQARSSATLLPCDRDHGGIDRVADAEDVSLLLDAALTARLLRDAPSAYRTQVNDLLLAALARAVRQWSGLDEVLVELEGHGREDVFTDVEITRTVGWFTTAFPVRLAGGSLDDATLIKTVKEELRGIPGRGLGYGVLRYLGSDEQRQALSSIADPKIVFNYLGQFDGSLSEASPFAVARESAGPAHSASAPLNRWLSINGQVRDGQLRLSFGYGRKRYRRETIEAFAEAYGLALRQLVEHCTGGACGVTPSDLPLSGLSQSELDVLSLDWRAIEDVYPLSPMQQGMLFHALRDGESGIYVNQVAVEMRNLDPAKLQAAWEAVSSRHAVLRTGFVWQGLSGTAQQVVYRQVQVPFVEEDWRERAATLDRAALSQALAEASRAERAQGFDLSRPPLQRVRLIRLSDNSHWLIWTHHHILLDGWSSARLIAEVMQHEGGGALPAVQGRYRDYIGWLAARDRDASATFWRDALVRLEEPSLLADALAGGERADTDRAGHGSLPLSIDAELTQRLQAFARRERVTLNTLVQGAWAQLLRRLTGQSVVSFGATVSGRPTELAGSEEMVGLFINTLPVVDGASPLTTIGAWLRDLQEQNLALRDHGWTPLNEIQRLAGRPGRPLFDSILVFENYPVDQALRGRDGETPRFGRVEHVSFTNYAMTVAVFAAAETINLGFRFDRSRFDEAQVEHVQRSFRHLLERMADDAERALGELGSLEGAIARQVLAWSGNVDQLPPAASVFRDGIVAQFEVHAARTPSARALVFGETSVSYGELNARANRLARRLQARGIGPDQLVGLALERSVELMVGVLAVLKAGGAYLPLDPDYPAERLAHMLRDSSTSLLLAHREVEDRLALVLAESGVEAWRLDNEPSSEQGDSSNLGLSIHPESLAYVIYTSGSTGIPKGTGCSHGALAGRLGWMQAEYDLRDSETLLQKTPVSFDVSVWEMFWPLAVGARLAIAEPGAHREPRRLVEAIRRYKVTTLHFVPAMLEHFIAEPESRHCSSLTRLFSGGEALSTELQARVLMAFPNVRFDNRYGPTEASINATYWTCRDDGRRVPIGPPIPGTVTRILDADLNPLPAGVTGELYLGGVGLARGYRGRAGLTAERFIPDPFGGPGDRLYRTGDLARWRADGVVDYVGRSDHQVKIRGFRIELGEIEARLLQQAGVRAAVVVAREAGASRQLVGYVAGDDALDGAELRTALSSVLPDYMVPARIMVLEQLPLMPNGKVDRKALPEPEAIAAGAEHVAPRTAVEITLAAIWAALLGQETVSVFDNFFELGGDSIVSLQMVSRARQAGLLIEPRDVFRHQTLEALALAARTDQNAQAGPVAEQGLVEGPHPLLPIQLRFLNADAGERHHWNQAVLLQPRARLDWALLGRALAAVVEHHDALRLRFTETNGVWSAEHGAAPAISELLWVRGGVADSAAVTTVAASAQASLSLSGPLLRAVGMDLVDGSQRLLVVIHHLVVDGVSWRVLLEDMAAAYGQLSSGTAVTLPPKSQSFASWGTRLEAYAKTDDLAAQLPYWQARASSAVLPCDEDHGGIDRVADAEDASLVLDAALTSRLLRDAPSAYRTQVNDLLLAALARAVGQWAGLDEVLVELEGHGREDIFADAEIARTVGWFTTAFPVRLKGGALDDAALIKTVKEELRSIPGRGLGYGVLRYLGTDEQRHALSAITDPKIVFNYLGQVDASVGEGSPFSLASESAGPARSPSAPLARWLSINGQVREGQLRLSFGYGRKRYRRETIERLAEAYAAALRQLVDHCTGGACGVTPSDVALSGLKQTELDALQLDWRNVEDVYPLSPMQQGMLFHALGDTESGLYVNQVSVEVRGLDASKLRAAWQAVSGRHAVLRTGFVWQGLSGAAQQVVFCQVSVPFIEEDWSERAATRDRRERDAALAEASRAERAKGFDLARPPLQRVRLIRLDDDSHWLIWTHHHILFDGWSSARLIAEVMQHQGGGALSAVQGRYRDYIGWLAARDHAASTLFWREALAQLEEPSFLADALGAPADGSNTGHGSLPLALDSDLTERLQAFGKRERVTVNTLVQGAWAQLLRRYTGQSVVSFGATVSGRPVELAGSEEMVGLFINTLPVVDAANPQGKVGAWLRDLQEQNLALREHGWTPLNEIQRVAGRSGRPLFDSILVFENYPVDQALKDKSQRVSAGETRIVETSNYPLFVSVALGEQLRLVFNYQLQHFDAAQIARLQNALVQLLDQLSRDAERPLGMIATQDAADRVLLAKANATVDARPRTSVVAQIEARAVLHLDAVALVFGDDHVSYGELNTRANRLARRLRAHGVGPDRLVGLALERSPTMMVALLAVLKAGGAYLPLDPDYPADRLAHMLRDSGAALVLTQHSLSDRLAPMLAGAGVQAWMLDDPQQAGNLDGSNLDVAIHPESLAYVIYTSGSTGQPKGVMVRHDAVTNFVATMAEQPGITANDRVLGLTSLSFDIAVLELWLPLTVGARIVLVDRAAAHDPAKLKAIAIDEAVTVIQATPSTWRMLADHEGTPLPSTCRVLCGGEALAPDLARRLVAQAGEVWNVYGPTETTVWSARHRLDPSDDRPRLGGPIGNTTLHILDGDLNAAPVGVAGELYIGGEGLARGYWQRGGLTAERFIPDPFATKPGERLYRTGDLACWCADGVMEYVGRADHQVKIRGFRIELGEIETRLRAQTGVRDAVVVAREAGAGRQLVGYVTGEGDLDTTNLRGALAAQLPDYMVPARILVLERLPLTPNGKVDRKALPAPEALAATAERIAPRNPIEQTLAVIWADLLRQEVVGVTDNFFELGGDSIVSLQMISRSRQAGLVIAPRDVFQHQTLEALALVARADERPTVVQAVQARGALSGLNEAQLAALDLDGRGIEDIYPLSPMQQGMLFHALRDAGSGIYVNQISVEIRGLDVDRLQAAWREVTARHAILRTGFLWRELQGSPLQAVYREAQPAITVDDWRGQSVDEARIKTAVAGERTGEFDLSKPPLQRVRLLRLDEDRTRLIWTYHHILMDGWSSARFIADIFASYDGTPSAATTAHYRDYIAWLAQQDATDTERFWREQLQSFDAPTQLADAFGAQPRSSAGHGRCYTRLDQERTSVLKAFARRERVTLNTVIQGVWALLLRRYSGQPTVTFGVTVAGRPAGLDGAQEMLGLFINTLPVIETPPSEVAIGDWLRALQQRNAAIRDYEQTPLYEIQGWAGRAGQPLFDSIIVFENYPIERGMLERGNHGLTFSGLSNVDVTNYPMDLSVLVEDVLQVEYTYLNSHFSAEQAEQIRTQFELLLETLTGDASLMLDRIDPVTARDRQFADACNSHATPLVATPMVHEAIAAHATRDPQAVALIIGADEVRYGDLDRRANHLAHALIARGLRPEQRVGIVVERTPATMIALLAVLKAGGAYVPLDPDYPVERLSYIASDAGISLLLTARAVAGLTIPDGVTTIRLDGFDFEAGLDHAPQPALRTENLAYLIYTSGSTGQPKGVAVTHGPLAMHCLATGALYEIDQSSCELHFLSLAFDGAHERWLTVLTHGARLLMRDGELWTPEQTADALRAHRASHIGLPPAYLQQLADWVEQTGNPPPMKLYSFGGEAMPKAGFDKLKRVLKPRIMINGYGPTETVVTPLVWKVGADESCDTPYAPIGLPVGDRCAYILDAALNIVPASVAGELYLGGSGLARGYHGRAAMTSERFVPDPFAIEPGARLYRTGDLARWRADGVIEYLGRTDDQVKINGFRIELGEIQTRLLDITEVAQAAVVALSAAAGSQLVAYVAPKDSAQAAGEGAERFAARLTDHLRQNLPAYMVPARMMVLERLPVMPSGKIDRQALPAPDLVQTQAFVAPQTPAEIGLARLWAEILKLPEVGVTDNFFELGGNSILSLKVVARVRQDKTLGVEIKLRDLLQKPTIRELLGGADAATAAAPTKPSALLPLNAAVTTARPVFCLHGGFGTVFDYDRLATRLDGRRRVYGLQSRMLISSSWNDPSLAAMAVDYAAEIRRVQPQGPYTLVGWSLGGLLAALVTAELERSGASVDCLALVDSFVPSNKTTTATGPAATHWSDELAGLLSAILPAPVVAGVRLRAKTLRMANTAETPEAIQQVITQALEDGALSPALRQGLPGADDIVRAFAVGRHLRDLAQQASLPSSLKATARCWWTAGRLDARTRLEAVMVNASDQGVVGDDHFGILKHAAWLDAIDVLLRPETGPAETRFSMPEPAE